MATHNWFRYYPMNLGTGEKTKPNYTADDLLRLRIANKNERRDEDRWLEEQVKEVWDE